MNAVFSKNGKSFYLVRHGLALPQEPFQEPEKQLSFVIRIIQYLVQKPWVDIKQRIRNKLSELNLIKYLSTSLQAM